MRLCVSAPPAPSVPHPSLHPTVFLVESIDADHSDMMHLKAIVYVRPTRENLARLRTELREPKFAEYHLCKCPCLYRALAWRVAGRDFGLASPSEFFAISPHCTLSALPCCPFAAILFHACYGHAASALPLTLCRLCRLLLCVCSFF